MAMIYHNKTSGELPEGAVKITQDQAIRYQMGIIDKWEKFSDVLMLKSGPGVLSGLAVVSSLLINNHFRYKLKLGVYGRMTSYLTVVATPAIVSALLHTTFIQSMVILKEYDCPLCLQTRAGILQAGTAVMYPFILAPAAAFMYATRHFTYKLPSVTAQPKEVFKLWAKFTKSSTTLTCFLLSINVLGAMFITSRQMQEHYNINLELAEYEKKIEHGSFNPEEELVQ